MFSLFEGALVLVIQVQPLVDSRVEEVSFMDLDNSRFNRSSLINCSTLFYVVPTLRLHQ